jgi:serine/threonine protein kinase
LDIWALGVTLYLYLFSGVLPFRGETNEELRTSILSREIDWETLVLPGSGKPLSNDCKNLLKGLLNKDPAQRISIADVCYHDWIFNM